MSTFQGLIYSIDSQDFNISKFSSYQRISGIKGYDAIGILESVIGVPKESLKIAYISKKNRKFLIERYVNREY